MNHRRSLPQRVLAIGAHPDDIELLCAGTLARFLQEECVVHLAIVCRGDRGGAGDPEALAATRAEESRQAADLLGAGITMLGCGDSEVRDTPELRCRFLDMFRDVRPELVLTHGPDDYHADHRAVGELATQAAWLSASPGQRTDRPPLDRPPAVLFMDNVAGLNFDPTHFVDVTDTMPTKRRMLSCHASQLARADGGISALAEMAEALARLRGFQCGTTYAEGFRPARWGLRRPDPLLP